VHETTHYLQDLHGKQLTKFTEELQAWLAQRDFLRKLENAGEAYQAFRGRGLVPEVTLLQISRGESLARYLRYEALNPIQIFAVTKPDPLAAPAAETAS